MRNQFSLPLREGLTSIEVCAGAGGQALGLERAGFDHEALVEIEPAACRTLELNRPNWNVHEADIQNFNPSNYRGVDVLAGGLPCPPFSVAGKQLGEKDERNLFPRMLEIVDEVRPSAVMIENVRGFLAPVFEDYRDHLKVQFANLGYDVDWKLLNASDFGVSQLRPRVVIVALLNDIKDSFSWPEPDPLLRPKTVGQLLQDLMASRGWEGASEWTKKANSIAPTIVGGSKKHGGPDLGPTRAKRAWAELGVNGHSLANDAPDPDFEGHPKLTVRMVARIQGFPDDWEIYGRKTKAYRQIGNAFPPQVAEAVAQAIRTAVTSKQSHRVVV